MKKQILFTIILIALHQSIFAQKKHENFQAFWKTFKTALIKNDKPIIINAINFPIDYNYEALDAKLFNRKYDTIFTKANRDILVQAKIEKDKNGEPIYYVNNNSDLIGCVFREINGKWKLVLIYGSSEINKH